MKRPFVDGDYWRLDKILERKAVSSSCVFEWAVMRVEVKVVNPQCKCCHIKVHSSK
jgi:hypothetical protein